MSTLRIVTKDLVGLLGDLTHTAASDPAVGAVAGVLLHTTRGYIGADPGQTTILVGTSTTGRVAGHTYAGASGTMEPALWQIEDVRCVVAVLKPRTRDNPDHAVEIRVEDDHVTVAEDPDLFGDGLTLTFGLGSIEDYPRSVWSVLSDVHVRPAPAGEDGPVPAMPRTDFSPGLFDPFVKVGKSRGALIELYRYHQRLPLLVQIGDRYRGAILPYRWDGDGTSGGMSPSGDVYPPALPVPDGGGGDD